MTDASVLSWREEADFKLNVKLQAPLSLDGEVRSTLLTKCADVLKNHHRLFSSCHFYVLCC